MAKYVKAEEYSYLLEGLECSGEALSDFYKLLDRMWKTEQLVNSGDWEMWLDNMNMFTGEVDYTISYCDIPVIMSTDRFVQVIYNGSEKIITELEKFAKIFANEYELNYVQ